MKGHCDHCYGYDSINDDNEKMGNDNSDKMTMLMMRTMISGHQGGHYNQYDMMIFMMRMTMIMMTTMMIFVMMEMMMMTTMMIFMMMTMMMVMMLAMIRGQQGGHQVSCSAVAAT